LHKVVKIPVFPFTFPARPGGRGEGKTHALSAYRKLGRFSPVKAEENGNYFKNKILKIVSYYSKLKKNEV